MPVVPRYDSPKVQSQSAPSVRISDSAPDEAFNIGQSRNRVEAAQDRLVGTLGKIAQEEKKKADQVRLLEFDSELSKFQTTVEYGPNGIYSKKGKDAASIHQPVEDLWNKKTTEMIESLSNDDQREAAKAKVLQRWDSLNSGMQRHTFSELQKHDANVTESFLKNAQNEAMENFGNPERIQKNLQEQIKVIQEYAARNGEDAETIKQKIDEATGKTHALVISKLSESGNDLLAKKYFEANKDQITGPAEIQIDKMLKESSLRGESQRLSDSIVGKARSMTEALDKARDIEDPETKDATVTRIKDFYATKRLAERNQEEDLHKYATNLIEKTGKVDAIPANIWAQFSLSDRSALRNYAKNRAQGQEPATDWSTYYDLKTMASDPKQRSKFENLNLMTQARPYLDDTKFSEIVTLQAGIRKGDSKTEAQLDGFMTDKQVVDTALKNIGITEKKKKKYEAATKVIDLRVETWQKENQKKIPNSELRKILDEELKEVVLKKNDLWFDDKKRSFEITPEDVKVPQDELPKIKEALIRNNRPVNDSTIRDLYLRKLRKGQ